VIARERPHPISIANAYRKVAIMSETRAGKSQGYLDAMKQETPKSRLGGNGRLVGLETTIKSISPMGQGAALVRFDVSRIGFDGYRAAMLAHFVATVAYWRAIRPDGVRGQARQSARNPGAILPGFPRPARPRSGRRLLPVAAVERPAP
jgi:type IV secretion system protein VirB8